ncbi:carbohydrate ABC transporter permease [Cohnella cholangitidis]|uniref:Carbohydrate ABC transporter permease n=1 Tax=Cohnella cholangitidis TaxID=2598458 RepID=A0A7G5C1T8_9BACL|nr:carbohydrate ABC transporter permease [Cohnella cholangitidis]QMV43172.1 carbohydrate ABC transporter permease [Cohnella cholangitidis]
MRLRAANLKQWSVNLLVLALALIFLTPFYLSVVTSFKTPLEIAESVLSLPEKLAFANYSKAMDMMNMGRSFFNSLIVTVASTTLIILSSSMGAYVIARNYAKRGYRMTEVLLLAALMIPFQIIMIPVYKLLKTTLLLNSLTGAILILVGTSIPYCTFLLIGFIKSVPRELEESAIIDGCGPYRTFWQIVFPLLKPITSCLAVLYVLWMWNDFNVALIVLQKEAVKTLTVQQFYFFGENSTEYGLAFAAACLSMLPIVAVFLLAQKYIIEGLTAGALKG